MDTDSIIKCLADTIPQGEHPDPWEVICQVRLDVVEVAISRLDRLEKRIREWRDATLASAKQADAARATARIAITHLQTVLAPPSTFADQQRADTAARDWLASIGA